MTNSYESINGMNRDEILKARGIIPDGKGCIEANQYDSSRPVAYSEKDISSKESGLTELVLG